MVTPFSDSFHICMYFRRLLQLYVSMSFFRRLAPNQEAVCNWYPLAKEKVSFLYWSVTWYINHTWGRAPYPGVVGKCKTDFMLFGGEHFVLFHFFIGLFIGLFWLYFIVYMPFWERGRMREKKKDKESVCRVALVGRWGGTRSWGRRKTWPTHITG